MLRRQPTARRLRRNARTGEDARRRVFAPVTASGADAGRGGFAFILSAMLAAVVFCAGKEYRRSPALAICAMAIATAARAPTHSQQLAELVGVGRGVDLILYCISLLLLLDLHLKLREQMGRIGRCAQNSSYTEVSHAQKRR